MKLQYWLPLTFMAAAGAAQSDILSLKIGDEMQPPGGTVQMKLFLTEPKPISTGKGKMALAQTLATDVEGVSLISAGGDAVGAAVIHGTQVRLICIVPSATFGATVDSPILTITGKVSGTASVGASNPLNINPKNLIFLDASGTPYTEEINAGTLTIDNGVSITDISPGGTVVPANGVIVIQGLNFQPNSKVQMKEVHITDVQYVSPTELDVTVRSPLNMQGQGVTVQNPDGTSATYYAFQRTTVASKTGSSLFRATYPVFAGAFWTSASFSLPVDVGTTYSGLAVANLQTGTATVTVSLVSAGGSTLGAKTFLLAPNTRRVQKAAELVAVPPPAGSYWLLQSTIPIQMLGLNGDDSTGLVTPILPFSTM